MPAMLALLSLRKQDPKAVELTRLIELEASKSNVECSKLGIDTNEIGEPFDGLCKTRTNSTSNPDHTPEVYNFEVLMQAAYRHFRIKSANRNAILELKNVLTEVNNAIGSTVENLAQYVGKASVDSELAAFLKALQVLAASIPENEVDGLAAAVEQTNLNE